jgi:hypothetical protein
MKRILGVVTVFCAVLAATTIIGGGTPAAAVPCSGNDGTAAYGSAPSRVSAGGVKGTTSTDVASFAHTYNRILIDNCLGFIPPANFHYDQCLQDRLFWIAEDPSKDPASAWGHGAPRSDGARMVGCDGNLAGGNGYTGKTAADRWWTSPAHRQSLFRPGSTANHSSICIGFAMTHGGVPDEPRSFARASAVRHVC